MVTDGRRRSGQARLRAVPTACADGCGPEWARVGDKLARMQSAADSVSRVRWRWDVWPRTFVVAWIYDLPVRDPDSVAGPTWLRLPRSCSPPSSLDVVPRAPVGSGRRPCAGVAGRRARSSTSGGTLAHVRFALRRSGRLVRHLRLVPEPQVVRALRQPPPVGRRCSRTSTGCSSSATTRPWSCTPGSAPASRRTSSRSSTSPGSASSRPRSWSRWSGPATPAAGAWYVTAIAVDWVLGALTYFAVPTPRPGLRSRPTIVRRPRPHRRHLAAGSR